MTSSYDQNRENGELKNSIQEMAIHQASFFKSIEKTFGSQDKSISQLVKIAEDQEKREAQRDKDAKKESAYEKKKDKKAESDNRKKSTKATQNKNKALIVKMGESLTKSLSGTMKSIFGKNPLMTLLKGVGLFALFKNAEALAKGIKGIAGAVADLWATVNSKEFKDGLGVITGFLSEIVKFGVGSLDRFLKGITGLATGLEDLLNSGSLSEFGQNLWDLKDPLGRTIGGFVGLAAILAPGATLMVAIKGLSLGLQGLNKVINIINNRNGVKPTKPTGGGGSRAGGGAARGGARPGPSSSGSAPVTPPGGNVINPATGQPFKPGMAGTSAGRAPSIPKPSSGGAAGAFSWKNLFTIKNLKSGIKGGLIAMGLEYLGQQFIVNPFRKWLIEQKSGWITGWSEERIDKLLDSMQNKGKDYQAFQAAALLGAEQRKPGTLTDAQLTRIGALKLQKGGAVNVPGSGSGDKVPMMLPAGSFVMNRNAARFQSGGMVPTMLEPGEKVYGPGQWGPAHALLNSGVPRFQNGGVVYGQHYDTGSGYTAPGMNDDQGRPVILSKDAMTAFVKMVTDSNGAVKASDVASSSRSAAKNAEEGGVPNSAHLYGEAIDIHGGSQDWIKANGSKYGWKYIDYNGTHGGHFKYVDGDMMTLGGAPDTSGSLLSGLAGMDLSFLGGFAKMFDVIKPLAGLMGLAGSSLNLFGNSTSTTGTPSSNSAPLTGDAKAKARQMYDYMISKGVSPIHARGILANINAESGFRTDVMGDGGTSGGLFQMHAGRYSAMEAAVPNWRTNWKGQIDHALATDRAPEYLGMSFGNGGDAAKWFMDNYERPAQYVRGQRDVDQRAFIQGLGYQQGGVVGGGSQMKLMSGDANLMSNNIHVTPSQHTSSYNQASRMGRAMGMYDLGGSNKPVIIPMPVPAASSAPSGQASSGSQTPHIPAYPRSAAASDYIFRSAMSSMLS